MLESLGIASTLTLGATSKSVVIPETLRSRAWASRIGKCQESKQHQVDEGQRNRAVYLFPVDTYPYVGLEMPVGAPSHPR